MQMMGKKGFEDATLFDLDFFLRPCIRYFNTLYDERK